jgi:hypothetical protein
LVAGKTPGTRRGFRYAAVEMQPNPPRGITILVAVVLLVIGAILAVPISQAVKLLDPLATALAPAGIHFDRQLGYIALLAGDALLILGSLVRGL